MMDEKGIKNWEQENPTSEEEESLTEALEVAARDVVEDDCLTVNMGKKRATDMRNNRNVIMPGPGPTRVEANHAVRVGVWLDVFEKYRRRHCDEQGNQRNSWR